MPELSADVPPDGALEPPADATVAAAGADGPGADPTASDRADTGVVAGTEEIDEVVLAAAGVMVEPVSPRPAGSRSPDAAATATSRRPCVGMGTRMSGPAPAALFACRVSPRPAVTISPITAIATASRTWRRNSAADNRVVGSASAIRFPLSRPSPGPHTTSGRVRPSA
ncbi:hypothetical protein SDC9_89787 [bioreactor metagenome]|uniref:Uncharacterized protein n=1 Tax=bioreactor metagenome TaxID=1076179 RepID=A0A644ZZW7_9ZZZZ